MTVERRFLTFSAELTRDLENALERESRDDHLTDEERTVLVVRAHAERPDGDWTGNMTDDFVELMG